MRYPHYRALHWFRFAVGLGFVINLAFVLPALFAPRSLEQLLTVGVTNTPHWLQDAGVLLLIVTAMYIPAIRDPFRYLFITYLLVAGRFAAGLFFSIGLLFMDYPSGMWVLAGNDLVLSVLQAVLLYFTLQDGDPRSGHANRNLAVQWC